MAITIPMVPEASNKGNGEKKKNLFEGDPPANPRKGGDQ